MLPGCQNGPGQIPEIQFEIKFRAGRGSLLPRARDLPLAVLEGAFTHDLDISKRTLGFQARREVVSRRAIWARASEVEVRKVPES